MEIIEETVTNDNGEETTLYKVNDMIFSTRELAEEYIATEE